jgi:PAS domain S-box-containing protein
MPSDAIDQDTLLDFLFEATNDGVVDWDLEHGQAHYNERWRFLLGWDEDGFEAKENTWLELINEQDRGSLEKALSDHLEQGWPFVQTVRMQHRTLGWRWILIRGASRKHADGTASRMVIFFADIDEKIRAEAQLRALIDAMPDTLFRIRSDGTLLTVKYGNDFSAIPGHASEKQCQLFGAIQESEAGSRLIEAIRNKKKGHAVEVIPCRMRSNSGELLHYEIRVVPSGEDEAVCIVRDVTREKQIEERLALRGEMEAIGHLAAGLAHEINTPLQFIGDNIHFANDVIPELLDLVSTYKGVIKKGVHATPEELGALEERESALDIEYVRTMLGQVLGKALDGVEEVAKIIKAMKMFEEVGKQTRSPRNLNSLVENATIVTSRIWSPVAELTLSMQPGLPLVPCIPGEIAQAVINLVMNAAQAIERKVRPKGGKGRISIETRHDPGEERVEIKVCDDGEGIPQAIRSRIFDPFFSTMPVGKARGQGLTQVHAAIVSTHQGSLHFKSEEGKGTSFIARLPIKVDDGVEPIKTTPGNTDFNDVE